jgi:ATP-binding cassette subfamily F protein uup
MAVLISCSELGKSYPAKPLFSGLTLGINEGERIGLIGRNGSGKSTLLKIFAGLEDIDSGSLSIRKGVRAGYVAQVEDFPSGATPRSVILNALPKTERYQDSAAEAILSRAGFLELDQDANTLSGGWRKRLAIASAFAAEPDLLLLDEPTNHLDLEAVLWLEQLLSNWPGAAMIVTHDRVFLERVTNVTVELDPLYREGYLRVDGPYSEMLVRRESYMAGEQHRESSLDSAARREIEWLRRGAPARTTKAQSRIDDAGELIRELNSTRKRLDTMKTASIDFVATGRRTKDLVIAKGISAERGGKLLFRDLDVSVSPHDVIGIVGANGSGKTTLIEILTGQQEPDSGKIKRAENLQIAWLHQDRDTLDPDVTLRDTLAPNSDFVRYAGNSMHVSGWASRFLFGPEQLVSTVGRLSGGERARVLIARLMLVPADILVLDEPTNDLDLQTLDVLADSLASFPGAVLLVSHDRYLIERLCTRLLGLHGDGRATYHASVMQWERASLEPASAFRMSPSSAPVAAKNGLATPPKQPMTSAERREYKEKRIAEAETLVKTLQHCLEDPDVVSDAAKLQELWEQIPIAEADVLRLYARWEELEAKQR